MSTFAQAATTLDQLVVALLGLVAALVALFGLRLGARFDAIERRIDGIEKGQAALAAALERLERRMDDGLGRLTDRIDRLYAPTAAVWRGNDPELPPGEAS